MQTKRRVKKNIRNKRDGSSKTFQRVVCNLTPVGVRNDSMAGRDYLVVPAVMLLEGVHNGSEGAFYYPASECRKRVELWNNKPVVVYHPSEPSACTPEVLNTRGIGVMMNTKWDPDYKVDNIKVGGLKTEVWLENSRVEKVDKRILEAIENGEVLELSTGLFADSDEVSGEWKGEEYQGTLCNFGPDHLAILPDQIGACSVADGAGFFRNQEGQCVTVPPMWMQHFNELSQNVIREALNQIIRKDEPEGEYWYVEDIFDTYFVYSTETVMYRQDYTVDGNNVSVQGVPTAVQRVVSYEPITNKEKPVKKTAKKNARKDSIMNKKKIIDALIANTATKWTEDDREFLNGLEDGRLEQMSPVQNDGDAEGQDVDMDDTGVIPEGTVQNKGKGGPQDIETYLQNSEMPEAVKNTIRDSMERMQEDTDGLVSKIMANKKNTFSEAFLRNKSVKELRGIVNLFVDEKNSQQDGPQVIPMFNYGAGDPVSTIDNNVPALPTPVLNYGQKKQA